MKATGRIPIAKRLNMFLGSYPLRLLLNDGNAALVGRGSVDLIRNFRLVRGQRYADPIIEIGNYCESAACEILLGGEHRNERIFNNSLGTFPALRGLLTEVGEGGWQGYAPNPTRIGHGVILSLGCTVLQGANIGVSSVVGAQAVVTRSALPAFCVAAGNPARAIKSRIDERQKEMAEALAWWDWDVTCLLQHMRWVLDVEANFEALMRVKQLADNRHRLVIDLTRMQSGQPDYLSNITGYEEEGCFISMEEAPAHIRNYFAQLRLPENHDLTWVPDIFKANVS